MNERLAVSGGLFPPLWEWLVLSLSLWLRMALGLWGAHRGDGNRKAPGRICPPSLFHPPLANVSLSAHTLTPAAPCSGGRQPPAAGALCYSCRQKGPVQPPARQWGPERTGTSAQLAAISPVAHNPCLQLFSMVSPGSGWAGISFGKRRVKVSFYTPGP